MKKKQVLLLLTVLWMGIIFCLSARPADISTEDSHRIGKLVGQIFQPDFGGWNQERQMEFVVQVDHVVRKTAHFIEYAILGLLLITSIGLEKSGRKVMLQSWMLGIGYAMTDEFHQRFVPGRSGQISDVILDSGGVLFGIILSLWVWKSVKKFSEKHIKG